MKCAILRPTANGTNVIKYGDPVTCNLAELSGDTVVYYGYDYDLAAETIANTAGVKRKFLGDAKFTTTHVSGTFGGILTGTTIHDLTAVAVDCAIADVPIAFPAHLVQASDGEYYKKNLAGTSWDKITYESNDNNIKVASGSVPAIDAATRVVVTVNLGVLKNKTKALIGFYNATLTDDQIKNRSYEQASFNVLKTAPAALIPLHPFQPVNGFIPNVTVDSYMNYLIVFEDYTKANRIVGAAGQEKYDASTDLPYGIDYATLNVGVLCGWYSYDNSGVLGLNKKVQIESAWLTQSGVSTVLNIAFKNVDATPNSVKDFKVAVYE